MHINSIRQFPAVYCVCMVCSGVLNFSCFLKQFNRVVQTLKVRSLAMMLFIRGYYHVYCLSWRKLIKGNLTAVKKHKHKTWLNRKMFKRYLIFSWKSARNQQHRIMKAWLVSSNQFQPILLQTQWFLFFLMMEYTLKMGWLTLIFYRIILKNCKTTITHKHEHLIHHTLTYTNTGK